MTDIKEAILSIANLGEGSSIRVIMRPWMIITGLSCRDAVNMAMPQMLKGLKQAHEKLADSVDIFDEDQLQEAACRCLGEVTMYGDTLDEEDEYFAQEASFKMQWQGGSWHFCVDPRSRQRESSKSYHEALAAGREYLDR